MEKFIAGLLVSLGAVAVIFLFAIVGGTILWLIWPVAIPQAFPGLVENGTIAANLGWWASVCLTWVAGLLIKSTNNNKCND